MTATKIAGMPSGSTASASSGRASSSVRTCSGVPRRKAANHDSSMPRFYAASQLGTRPGRSVPASVHRRAGSGTTASGMRRFHETIFGIYFDDLDPFNILHNSRYLLLFERAVGAFWMDVGWGAFQDSDRPEQFHLVRHNAIDYLAPVRGVGKVRVRVGIEKIGTSSLTFECRMLPMDRDLDHARGTRTVVHVDPTTLEPRPWNDSFRDAMAQWCE